MDAEQRVELHGIATRMRAIAAPVGPLHALWDDIFEIEDALAGRARRGNDTPEQMIERGRSLLGEG